VACYVHARMQLAGVARPVFSQASLWLLHFYSRGIPRLINMLAHKALMLGFGKNKQQLGCAEIMYAARDTDDVVQPRFWWPVFISALLLLAYYLPGMLGVLGVRW